MQRRSFTPALLIAASLSVAACSSEPKAPTSDTAPAKTAASSVKATGDTITVETSSDGAGNYFKPAAIDAKRGDMLRFVLKSGVHNVHFLPDSNPGKANLPAASDMLQLPGQTLDLLVSFEPGTYYFQCDPHAALGMKAHLNVGG